MRTRVFSPTCPTWALVGWTSRPAGETVFCIPSGVANCLSRLVAGYLTDRIVYSKLMSGCGALLTINLVTIYFVGEHFAAILVCVWLVYLLGFTHFTAIPAQVQ